MVVSAKGLKAYGFVSIDEALKELVVVAARADDRTRNFDAVAASNDNDMLLLLWLRMLLWLRL